MPATSQQQIKQMSDFTVIFDMDGVILDSERIYQEIERSMYDKLGIPVSREEHRTFMGTAEKAMWTYMCDRYKLDHEVEDLIREERERFMKMLEIPGSIPLMKGLIPLLESLRKERISCWIASSSSAEIIAKVLKGNNLESFFQGYVSGDDVKRSKPSPEIFLKAARLSGTDPSKCLVIEDSENGIKAARAAGMAVIALDNPDSIHLDFTDAGLIIKSLQEISPGSMRQMLD